MKKCLLLLFAIIAFLLPAVAQNKLQEGYIIDSNGTRTKGFIKNEEWTQSPSFIKYSTIKDGALTDLSTSTLKEFGVGTLRFVRRKVKIDISPDNGDNMSLNLDAIWSDQELLLQVLIEGKANLYSWHQKNIERYFYSTVDTTIVQLVHKAYMVGVNLSENNLYLTQMVQLKCGIKTEVLVRDLKYARKPMSRYFKAYDECSGGKTIDRQPHPALDVHIKIAPGLDFSHATLASFMQRPMQDIRSQNFRLGVEFEFVLPYGQSTWGFVVEPSYQSFNKGKSTYSSFEIPVSLRKNFFIGSASAIFLNGGLVADLPIDSHLLTYNNKDYVSADGFVLGGSFGGGFRYKKLSLEFRTYPVRFRYCHSTDKYDVEYNFRYDKNSLIVGYRLK